MLSCLSSSKVGSVFDEYLQFLTLFYRTGGMWYLESNHLSWETILVALANLRGLLDADLHSFHYQQLVVWWSVDPLLQGEASRLLASPSASCFPVLLDPAFTWT